MKKSSLVVSISLALGLTACGGGGGGSTPPGATAPTPTPTVDVCANVPGVQTSVPPGYFQQGNNCTLTDACVNYDGLQTELEIEQKQFVRDITTGTCKLKMNHAALSSSGLDIARMQGHTGKDVVIHVSDTGFYPTHQEFTGRVAGSARFLYANGTTSVIEGDWESPAELAANDHGTSVASMAMGAKVGAAPGARLFAAFGVEDVDWMIKRGAKIINNSTSSFADNMMNKSARDFLTLPSHFLNVINNSMTVLVSAAGNETINLSTRFHTAFPNNTSCLEYPDEAENYLVVGAFEKTLNKLASYSNYPGHLKAFQDRFLVTGDGGFDVAKSKAPDSYYIGSAGTSLAAPIVSGALAILLEVNPRLSAIQAAQILLDTADRPASLGYGTTCTSTTPKGTFTTDCGAMKYGRGLMNVPKAIAQAKTM